MTITSHITPKHRARIVAGLRVCIGGGGSSLGRSMRDVSFMLASEVSTK